MLTDADVRELARVRFKKYAVTRRGIPRKGSSGMTNFCNKHDLNKSHVSLFMKGAKEAPPADLVEALGLFRINAYFSKES